MYNISKSITTFLVSCALLGGACDSELAQEDTRSSASVHRANVSLAGGFVADGPLTRFDELGELDIAGEANVAVDDLRMSAIEEAVRVQVGQLPDGSFGVLDGARGQEIAPGVWEVETEEGLIQQVIMGAEGHQWLIEQMTAQLDDLYGQLHTETGHEAAIGEQIAAAEAAIVAAERSLTDLAQPGNVRGLSCSVGLYAGPSGPVFGVPGAAAFAQSSCSGGCATITVRSQACCNGACTPLSIATNTVCAPLWTSGVIRQGSGPGWAQVYVAPVTVTNQGFSCY